jgi:hypothetical protein
MSERDVIHIDPEEDDDGITFDVSWWGTYNIYNYETEFRVSFCDHDNMNDDGTEYTACDDYDDSTPFPTLAEALQHLANYGQQSADLEYKGVIYRKE